MKTQYTVKLSAEFIDVIGVSKTIEGRLNKGIFAKIIKGDLINFLANDKAYCCRVTKIEKASTFSDLLANKFRKAIPNANSLEEALTVYRRFYSHQDELKNGVIGIYVKRL